MATPGPWAWTWEPMHCRGTVNECEPRLLAFHIHLDDTVYGDRSRRSGLGNLEFLFLQVKNFLKAATRPDRRRENLVARPTGGRPQIYYVRPDDEMISAAYENPGSGARGRGRGVTVVQYNL